MWATFATKAQKQLNMKFVCKFFLDFPIPASQCVSSIYELAWLAGIRKSGENLLKTSCKAAPVPKVAHIFYDVMTIENNRQVRLNIDATLVAIFHVD